MAAPNIVGVSDIAIAEGAKAQFAVSLSGPTAQAGTARLTLSGGTATAGTDYSTTLEASDDAGATWQAVASGGTATIKQGATSFLVRVSTLADATVEPTETYGLYVTPVTALGTIVGYGLGQILDATPSTGASTPSTSTTSSTGTTGAVATTTVATASVASTTTVTTAPSTGGIPTPDSIKGKPVVGRIVAVSGQVIQNVHVTSTSGPCILVKGVTGVVIRDSEIGPCGQDGDPGALGVEFDAGATNVTVQRNVIHDVSSGSYVTDSQHPIIFDRNYVYNIRGPLARGQMIQFHTVNGGTSRSRITCNVSDGLPGTRYGVSHDKHDVEDHINIFNSAGLTSDRTEIAYNRLRGGHSTSDSGSGIMTGDGQNGGNLYVHHNVITNVRNVGIGIAGGQNITLETNRIFMDAAVFPINVGMFASNYSGNACTGHSITGDQVWMSNSNSLYVNSNCGPVVQSGNVFGDGSLTAAIFDQAPAACQ